MQKYLEFPGAPREEKGWLQLESTMSNQSDDTGVSDADCPVTICNTPAEAIALTLQDNDESDDLCEDDVDSPVTICSTPSEAIALALQGHETNETTNDNLLSTTSATNIELDDLANENESDFKKPQIGTENQGQKKVSSQLKSKSNRRCVIIIGVLLVLGLVVAIVGVAFGTGIAYAIREGEILAPILILFNAL